ncbi:hypothetical protein SNEBB_000083 [Seison nebaliae]|nr:hypothetical protein SNEBB_000083 [Seison nebaliae]
MKLEFFDKSHWSLLKCILNENTYDYVYSLFHGKYAIGLYLGIVVVRHPYEMINLLDFLRKKDKLKVTFTKKLMKSMKESMKGNTDEYFGEPLITTFIRKLFRRYQQDGVGGMFVGLPLNMMKQLLELLVNGQLREIFHLKEYETNMKSSRYLYEKSIRLMKQTSICIISHVITHPINLAYIYYLVEYGESDDWGIIMNIYNIFLRIGLKNAFRGLLSSIIFDLFILYVRELCKLIVSIQNGSDSSNSFVKNDQIELYSYILFALTFQQMIYDRFYEQVLDNMIMS